MNILLTGNEGYIGSILAEELAKSGYSVTGLDTGYYSERDLYPFSRSVKTIKKDIRRVGKQDLSGFDAVIHLAELSNDPVGETDPKLTHEINHLGTFKLAKLAKTAGVSRFIYFSSCSVYGASDRIVNENSPLKPLTAYAQAKVLNEKYLLKLADKSFCPVIFRNATVYGASPRMRFDLAVNNLAGLAYTTKVIKLASDGQPWRPFVHILDISQAVKIALEVTLESIRGQIVNVGDTNSNYQIKTIAKIVSDVFPGCRLRINKNNPDTRNYRVNFDKIKKVLPGFSCRFDIATGAKELKQIFSKIKLKAKDFNSRHFTRLEQIKYLRVNNKINNNFFWL